MGGRSIPGMHGSRFTPAEGYVRRCSQRGMFGHVRVHIAHDTDHPAQHPIEMSVPSRTAESAHIARYALLSGVLVDRQVRSPRVIAERADVVPHIVESSALKCGVGM